MNATLNEALREFEAVEANFPRICYSNVIEAGESVPRLTLAGGRQVISTWEAGVA